LVYRKTMVRRGPASLSMSEIAFQSGYRGLP